MKSGHEGVDQGSGEHAHSDDGQHLPAIPTRNLLGIGEYDFNNKIAENDPYRALDELRNEVGTVFAVAAERAGPERPVDAEGSAHGVTGMVLGFGGDGK